MNERRIARLQEQIKHRLAEVFLRDIADPDLGMVTITRIEVDPEFAHCKAYWSVFGNEAVQKKTGEVLRRARGFCQREVGKVLHTRSVPHLEFVHDVGIAGAIQLNKLLDELKHEREEREAKANPDALPAETEPPTPPEPPRDA